jgi:methyl-accepting chemotaxis protein
VDAADGSRIGYAVEWRDRTDAVAVEAEINAVVQAAAEGDFSRRIELRKSGSNAFFVDLVEGFNRVLDINTRALENIVAVLDALANGDLTREFDGQYRGTLAKVQQDVNRTLRQLSAIVERIKRASGTIGDAAAQITTGNTQLSERSEREAANLAETSSNLERLTGTVKQNAEHARQARQLAGTARDVAERGGKAVGDVETTMNAIHQLSQKISDITGVIDGIAFQTNILALNSAVEAARAGEHGRGFAVVASEVRSLAQRAAAAAKEIKQLITTSVEQIARGTQLVSGAGGTMREIIGSVREVDQIMAAIAAASQDQSGGIAQVNAAVAQTDAATRENATLVEEATGSARSLEREAAELGDAVSIFKTSPEAQAGQGRPRAVRPLRSARS